MKITCCKFCHAVKEQGCGLAMFRLKTALAAMLAVDICTPSREERLHTWMMFIWGIPNRSFRG